MILTLNTVAHTVGAAGAGAQATVVFGSVYLGVFSAILTLAILIFSEIIPKALGATYWRSLAPTVTHALAFLVKVLFPFVLLAKHLTQGLASKSELQGFSRDEFTAMADLGEKEGQLEKRESVVLKNLFKLREISVEAVMTPRSVVFSAREDSNVDQLLDDQHKQRFSRIPIYETEDNMSGFVLRDELLEAHARGEGNNLLRTYRRDLSTILDQSSLLAAFEEFIRQGVHLMLVVNEYGEMEGVLSLEDILESLLGLEIMDESDSIADLQRAARRLGEKRLKKLGLASVEDD